MDLDSLERASIDFISNGGEMPDPLKADERFKATALMLRHICLKLEEHCENKTKHQSLRDQISLKVIGLCVLAVALIHSALPPDLNLWDLISKLLP